MSQSPAWERIYKDYTAVHRKFKIKTSIATDGSFKMLISLEHEHLKQVGFDRKFTEGAQDVQDAHRIFIFEVCY